MISNMENNKKLSVIIVNYKSEQYLERCLLSLHSQVNKTIDFEVIIVNNYPSETLEKIRNIFPDTQIILNSRNGGFGHGNNVGARAATGEFLFFLNPDTEIITGSLVDVIKEFESNSDTGAVGGCLMTEKQKVQRWSAGTRITLWDIIKNNLGIISSRRVWEKKTRAEAGWVAGTALFVSRELFSAIGGFDENIFMYFEDVDLCERIKAKNKRIIYFPEFKVLHKCGGSYERENKKNQNKNYHDSLLYYFAKHRPKAEYMIVKVLRKLFFV